MFDAWKVELVCLSLRQLSGFLNNIVRVYSVKLKIGMLYRSNNTSKQRFLDICRCAFKNEID